MIVKDKAKIIKKSFNRAAKNYHLNNNIQNIALNKILTNLKSNQFEKIADFACGIGISTNSIFNQFNPSECYGIDIADQSLFLAKENLDDKKKEDINLIYADFNDTIFKENSLDLAFSNMGFQWSNDLKKTFNSMYFQLKKNGILAFSMPLEESFNALHSKCHLNFYHQNKVTEILIKNNFKLIKSNILNKIYHFNSAYAALKSVQSVGANINFNQEKNCGLMTKSMLENYFKFKKNYDLNYSIGIFIAQKIE